MDAYEAHFAAGASPLSAADTCYVCMRSRHTGPCAQENCPQKRKVPRKDVFGNLTEPTDRAVENSFKRVPGACPDLDQEPPHPDEAAYRELVQSKAESPAGEHYRQHGAVQPIDLIESFELGYHEGAVIKYVSRWRDKNGVEDLRKARWFLDRLIQIGEPPK